MFHLLLEYITPGLSKRDEVFKQDEISLSVIPYRNIVSLFGFVREIFVTVSKLVKMGYKGKSGKI